MIIPGGWNLDLWYYKPFIVTTTELNSSLLAHNYLLLVVDRSQSALTSHDVFFIYFCRLDGLVALGLSTTSQQRMPRQQKKRCATRRLTADASEWTLVSQRDRIRPHQECTWDDPRSKLIAHNWRFYINVMRITNRFTGFRNILVIIGLWPTNLILLRWLSCLVPNLCDLIFVLLSGF